VSSPKNIAAERVAISAKPRARTSRVAPVKGLAFVVAIAAPPIDGAANDELIRFLSEVLHLPRSALAIVQGASGRRKLVEVQGLTESEIVGRAVAAPRK
jgi:uncharacterized protein YggU (UPF0235/DUF167 family)